MKKDENKVVRYYYSTPISFKELVVNEKYTQAKVVKTKRYKRHTFAVIFDTENNKVYFGLATCLPVDNFVKKIGREIAERNALTSPFMVLDNFNGIRSEYLDQIRVIIRNKEKMLLKKDCPKAKDVII